MSGFDEQAVAGILEHMNEDHADAVLLYARVQGRRGDAEAARMIAIRPEDMTLAIRTPAGEEEIRVAFDHALTGSEDAHHTLVAMVREARERLAAD